MLTALLLLVICQTEIKNLPEYLEEINVTVLAKNSAGSGTVVVRQIDGENCAFVITAAHVIDGLRSVTEIIDTKTGTKRSIVSFEDPTILKNIVEKGRKVGELKMIAKVIKFSDPDRGEDFAILMMRKTNFATKGVKFYLKDEIPTLGSDLFHMGSLLGSPGSNSLTNGIISATGRLHGDKELDQTSCVVFPGSSGGCLVFSDKNKEHMGEYLGMLVMGYESGFTFYTPIRRIKAYLKKQDLMWLVDESVKTPTRDQLEKITVEDNAGFDASYQKVDRKSFLIQKIDIKDEIPQKIMYSY